MEINYDKRTYTIVDNDKKYEAVHIVKHPNKEYDNDSYYFYEWRDMDPEEMSGFWCFEPSDELINKLKEVIREYEQLR
jgi:hypothetical protein